jgi:hypothetical protein
MTIKFNTAIRNIIVDNLTITVGTELRIYTGTAPASADDVATGTLLCTITIANGFTASAAGSSGLVATESAVAVDTGTAGWARWTDGFTYQVDGSVGVSAADFIINSTAITSGGTVTLTEMTITQPAS